jgi:hypothetical protein
VYAVCGHLCKKSALHFWINSSAEPVVERAV